MRRAAQYVRMSTDHQKYSTENQADTIRRYADERGITIVRTYADAGKSGLRIDGRKALQQMLADVQCGNADYEFILAYDVSRWGRFQDADESAYYEYICRSAGISVHYCAEQFENDGSLSATIIKGMKRVMAGEFSRELSNKVFQGHCKQVHHGRHQGGLAGYGLRRQLLDENGLPKTLLQIGQQKSLQSDRIILVPGPANEVNTILRMYRLFVEHRRNESEISAILNGEGKITDLGRPWTRGTVHQVLTNEKYIGNNVYNRTSFKLKKRRVRNAADIWVRRNGAYNPIVDAELFNAARSIIEDRCRRFSDQEMLDKLSDLLGANGYLSGLIIDERDDMPSSTSYRNRFGTLIRAYQLIGYMPGRDYRYVEANRFLRTKHREVVAEVLEQVRIFGGSVFVDPISDLLTINDEFTASIVLARCLHTAAGSKRWKIRFDTSLCPDLTIVVRMDRENLSAQDYYLLPRIDVFGADIKLADENGVYIDNYRVTSLETFFDLSTRTDIRSLA
nr:recombinase family protein [Phyllobacterium myrsinacearum]